MNLKRLIKIFTPSLIVEIFRCIQDARAHTHLWRGIYGQFQDVPASGEGYQGGIWIRSRTAQTRAFKEALAHQGTIPVALGFRYSSLGFLAAVVCQSKGKARIVDFGGAMGIAYPQLVKSVMANQLVDYYVIDNPASCEQGARLFADDPHIHFRTALDASMVEVDIVFMSGALQYIQDYRAIIETLARLQPRYFLFTCLAAGDLPTFASAQVNLKGSVLPAWFFNIHELVSVMTRVGYTLLFKVSHEHEDRINMDNLPAGFRLHYMANLLFSRQPLDNREGS